jgi:DNA-binding transcriptional LysR family regulator
MARRLLLRVVTKVERRVISGDVDLGLIANQPRARSFVVSVVAEDSLVLAVPKDHPLAFRSSVRLEELSKERFIAREPESASRALTEKRVFQKHPDWRFGLQINTSMQSSLLLQRASGFPLFLSGR